MIAEPQPWMTDAACRGMGPDLFFPTRGDVADTALAVCDTCPVSAQCLTYARTTPIYNGIPMKGIWGGTSENQRKKYRSDNGLVAWRRRGDAPCGTYAGYRRHLRDDEDICDLCRQAQRNYSATLNRRREAS